MSHAAVFITCQMPVKSGRPSLVRAIPGPPGVCADACVNASTDITTAIDGNVRALMNGLLARAVYSHDYTAIGAAALHSELFFAATCALSSLCLCRVAPLATARSPSSDRRRPVRTYNGSAIPSALTRT